MRLKKDHLRFEIAAALLVKVLLLTGLWFLIFRFDGHEPAPRADIAERFRLPPIVSRVQPPDASSIHPSETTHVRR
jgi:hypothetical protein